MHIVKSEWSFIAPQQQTAGIITYKTSKRQCFVAFCADLARCMKPKTFFLRKTQYYFKEGAPNI